MLQALTLGLAPLVPAASANTLTDADVQGFYAFDNKAATKLQDISDAARASAKLRPDECLQDLANQLTFVVSEFKFVEVMAELEHGSPASDTRVKTVLLSRADKFLSLLTLDRKAISTIMGLRSRAVNGMVVARGQEILRLWHEAGALVGTISKKIGQ
jgi:hypothetical protein